MRVVFMGTPDFAVPTLERLIVEHDVLCVFTQPDKPKGRGYELTPSDVKICALEHGIPVYQPATLKNGEAMPVLEELKPDVIVVAAFGMLLPKSLLDFPKYGCVNAHGSLLPKYRGAAPIQWSVLDGEEETGVTAMQMNEGLDTGDIILSKTLKIGENETAGELFDRLAYLAADVVSEVLTLAEKGELKPVPQDDEFSSYARMLSKADCPIDWEKPAQHIHNQVRGLSPWPTAQTVFDGKVLKIHKTRLINTENKMEDGVRAGTVVADKDSMYVVCGDGRLLELNVVQLQGAKRMPIAEFLRGHKPPQQLG